MGKKTDKICHQASRSVTGSTPREKEDVLQFYARLAAKGRPADADREVAELFGADEVVSVGDILELMKSRDAGVLADTMKKIGRLSEAGCDFSKIVPEILTIIKTNSDECVRYEAVKSVSKIKDSRAVGVLISVVRTDSSEKVKEGAVKALGIMRASECFGMLAEILSDYWEQSIRVRRAAAFSLSRLNPGESAKILCNSLVSDPDRDVRKEAAESLAVCLLKLDKEKTDTISRVILSQVSHESEPELEVRLAIINAITVAECSDCVDELINILQSDPDERVRGQAAHALSHFFDPKIEKALIGSLDRETGGIKKRVALAVANYAMRNPLGLHDEICEALIKVQKLYPRDSYIWKEAVKALPAC